ncbi:hypothetical protein MTR_8g005080 [Medicago truncatula]|uniref:Uncharacterized protein n=1 Tax=Medicago truncatula TaxID=3880 RepID=G7L9U6_MEDTR|nr:hypothetical protein MTR_8g005080 [Medicago truncatula]
MSEVAQIEGRVRYSAFKKTVKVMITPTDSLDDLKAQLNTYFEYLGENQYTRHLFGQMSCIDLGEDRDEYAWKTTSYMSLLIRNDGDVGFMFRNMVKIGRKNGLEMFRIMQNSLSIDEADVEDDEKDEDMRKEKREDDEKWKKIRC